MLRVHFKSLPPTNYRQNLLNEDEAKALKIMLAHANVRTDDLEALPLKALIDRNPQCDFSKVDDVILGSANQAGEDNRNIARMATLLAGLPVEVPATTINRLCGSGLNAIGIAMQAIKSGVAELIIAGGAESMTRAPFVMGKADNNYDRAQEAGLFKQEIVPVIIPQRKIEDIVFDKDEHPRLSRLEKKSSLKPFVKADGTITAANASGINDGAAALLIASKEAAIEQGLKPVAKILGIDVAGVEPRIMGLGPVPATNKFLKRLNLSLDDMDIIEINEAFSAQALGFIRQLGLKDDDTRINQQGGAIALGHPLGMSGSRLVITAMRQLQATHKRYALCA